MGKHALSTTEGVPDVLRKDLSSSQMEEKTGNSASVWSFITNHAHTFCRSNSSSNIHCGFRKNMRVRWNAAWRRAIIIDPVRCLQERVSGCHKALSSSTSKQPIWLLGVCYNCSSSEGHASNNEIYKQFETDIHSRIWVTYRRGFQVIMGTNITTDVGWGCMIRSAQMLLAQALICHRFGRSWRRSDVNNTTHSSMRGYLEILQCFGDTPNCPISIHNMVKSGGPYGLVPGSWMGPFAICRTLESLLVTYGRSCLISNNKPAFPIAVHVVAGEAECGRGGAPCICIEAILETCNDFKDIFEEGCGLMLLVPLVLGINKLNQRYLSSLFETFTFPQSLGILGGKPGASTYLVGVQGDQVLYMDPHHTQQTCIISPDNPKADTSTYHCSNLKRMPLRTIDPSLALGFYCRDEEDFKDLCGRAVALERKGNGAPIFTVVQSKDELSIKDSHKVTCPQNESIKDINEAEEGWQIL
ncbi:hypothetical protein KP509_33G057200 [Ceratopteris richardii]|uniref:Cysteine protease n=1 Tax=Ceratopteris richardii TaxID=49495 RepID=A0A8T2QRR9_CERRI|nr:hypothetical protein KP509_33G057200 [Ceratopteris richardii]